ncbi:AAA family ATPase [Vibrio renipiscarius]|uniref:AAA family ATPase n=1 Tax=Vibrio renipiscarius TaxID=1461322 RepID=UPI00354FCC45
MTPLKLTIQAFGPFAGKEEIDFTKLGYAPLFLINGPTGSGKSSILDAICFALYGETTGSERTGDQMRCDHAAPDLISEVSFEFSLGNKQYRIERAPDQMMPKKRGEGLTKKNHTTTLFQLDAGQEILIANKPTPVGKAIVDIIGLDVKQFRQVMVLPQGKFRELLIANSKEREVIFGQLFQTHIYAAIEKALFEKAAHIRRAKDEFDNQIKGALDVASVESEERLNAERDALIPQIALADEQLCLAKQAFDSAQSQHKSAIELVNRFAKRDALLQEKHQHVAKQPEIDRLVLCRKQAQQADALQLPYTQQAQAGLKLAQVQADAQHIEQQLSGAQQRLSQATINAEQASQSAQVLPELTEKLFKLNEVTKRLVERDKQQANLHRAEGLTADLQSQFKHNATRAKSLEQQAQSQQTAFQQAKEQSAMLGLKEAELDQVSKQLHTHQELIKTQQAAIQFRSILTTKQAELDSAKQRTEQAKTQADTLEYYWHSSQAAQLAKTLRQGEHCPVCGSLDHPQLATFTEQEVTKDQVDDARRVQQQCLSQQEQASAAVQHAQLDVAKVEQAVSGWQAQLSAAPLTVDQLQLNASELTQQIHALRAINLEQLAHVLQQTEQQSEQLQGTQRLLEKQLDEAKQQSATIRGTLNSLLQDIAPDEQDRDSVVAETQRIEQQRIQIQNDDQLAKQQRELASTQHVTLQAQWQSLGQQLSQALNDESNAQNEWTRALTSSPFVDEESYLQAKLSPNDIEAIEHSINQYSERTSSLNGALSTLEQDLDGLSLPNIDELAQHSELAATAYQKDLDAKGQLQSVLDNFNKVAARLSDLYQQNSALEKEYQVIGTLSDIANGRTGAKVSLHRFVLGVLLDDVLIQASQRLRVMSKGRYELRRREDRAKGNAGSGLDLMVEDGYSGKLRDVTTLSGGESFMAALALALGVSDVVQSYSGGIRLDTLFIDEGFGSLDPESLDLAIQTLIDLQQGGRTIGLISHVSELKEQMSLRVDVIAQRNSSHIRLQGVSA